MVNSVKGAAIRFSSYSETVPKILELLKLHREIKKYDKIVLKPHITGSAEESTPIAFVESVLRFCLENKNPVAEVFIAEGADGHDTNELFESFGYNKLAENYAVSLVDLNESETEEIENFDFERFEMVHYPKILKESLVISLPRVLENEELVLTGSMSNMLGAFPASHYKGFFSSHKNKIRKWPIKYSVHDVIKCKMPDFAVADATSKGLILAGLPLEIDKQGAKLFEKTWKEIPHVKLIQEKIEEAEAKKQEKSEFEA